MASEDPSPGFEVVAQLALDGVGAVAASDHLSYDYSDWWATRLGRSAKQLAYRTEPVGNIVFGAPVLLLEALAPGLRGVLGLPKRVYPVSVAQHGLACLELRTAFGDMEFLSAAKADVRRLLDLTAPSNHGLAWGFPFTWSSSSGTIPANQPAATQTAYAFDLFDSLLRWTGDEQYEDLMRQTAGSMESDYIDLPRPRGVANTYHGRGRGDVAVNAVSYRAHILARASQVGETRWQEKADSLVDYVLDRQGSDGSWVYGESRKNHFIDHFHTCFVLKNLARTNSILRRSDVDASIEAGTDYYWANLFDRRGLPLPFARAVRTNVIRYESYDFAECLNLFTLLGTANGFSEDRLRHVLRGFVQHFALPHGMVRFRKYRLPCPVGPPYHRYGMTASVLALARLLNGPLAEKRAS